MKKSAFAKYGKERSAEAFRSPMTVKEIHLYRDNIAFPVCPQCRMTLDREYQAYCDRCGQALSWKAFHKALVILID